MWTRFVAKVAVPFLVACTGGQHARAQCPNPTPIGLGEVVCADLEIPGESDCYAFDAEFGDVIWATFVEVPNTSISPRMALYDPNGTLVASAGAGSGPVAYLLDHKIQATGTHTIALFDLGDNDTGSYCFEVDVLNTPDVATHLTYGENTCSDLTSPAELDLYTFDAQEGDVIWATLVEVPNLSISPRLRLYDQAGTFVTGAGTGSGPVAYLLDQPLPATGTYTLAVYDQNGDDTGAYCVQIDRLNTPSVATHVAYGEVACSDLTSQAELDLYTFDAQEGDVVWATLVEVPNLSISPRLRLYDQAGTYVTGAGTGSGPVAYLLDQPLPTTGTYTLAVYDQNGDNTGAYCVQIDRLNTPSVATHVAYGEVACSDLTSQAELDLYTFDAQEGDVIWATLTEVPNASISPRLRLYDQAGTYITAAGGGSGPVAYLLDQPLPTTGTYTLAVYDQNGDNTGAYCVQVDRLNTPSVATHVAYGEVACSDLTSEAELDLYTFDAQEGDVIWATLVEVPNLSISPRFRLYDQAGTYVAAAGGDSGPTAYLLDQPLPTTGTYTLAVYDQNGDNTGAYCVQIDRLNTPSVATHVAYGEVVCSDLSSPAELDLYTFHAQEGSLVQARFVECPNGSVSPRLRLYDSAGTFLDGGGTSSGPLAFLPDFPIPATGTYTLALFDSLSEDTGPYRLNIRCLSTGCPCHAEYNGDGVVNVLDLLAFLACWFEGGCKCDFITDCANDITDLLDYLSFWFAELDQACDAE